MRARTYFWHYHISCHCLCSEKRESVQNPIITMQVKAYKQHTKRLLSHHEDLLEKPIASSCCWTANSFWNSQNAIARWDASTGMIAKSLKSTSSVARHRSSQLQTLTKIKHPKLNINHQTNESFHLHIFPRLRTPCSGQIGQGHQVKKVISATTDTSLRKYRQNRNYW